MEIQVYEIVSRCEPHADKDPFEASTAIRFLLQSHILYGRIVST
jgi:hypothetical protein